MCYNMNDPIFDSEVFMENLILIVGIITVISFGVAFVSMVENPKMWRFPAVMLCILIPLLSLYTWVL